jgi:7-cyano-7-deazaguanine synthase in queuosine biosynthesis
MVDIICGPEWDQRVIRLKPKSKVGVLMSSGMDSTTILQLLLTNFPDIDIKLFNIQTGPNKVKPVINKLLEQMSCNLPLNIIGEKLWDTPMYNHHARLWKGFQEIRDEWDVEELYCGNIQSPREEFFPRFNIHSPEFPKRPWLTKDPFLKNPLEHLEKYHVLEVGRRYGFTDLHKTTVSCNRYELWNCGECMGCDELKWAYKQLDDPEITTLDMLIEKADYDLTHDDTKNRDKEWWGKQ